jgi:dihydroorotate dehydrogenase (fumarate)
MANLSVEYMGLKLKNPIIVASSGLTDSADKIAELEKKGAAAVVLKSLFEEQILMDVDEQRMNNMYESFSESENYIAYYTKKNKVDSYLQFIRDAKAKATIPVIASINCVSAYEWTEFAAKIQEAGADAIELNTFIMPSDADVVGSRIEEIYFDIINKVKEVVTIPIALKISYYFSGLSNFVTELSKTGVASIVLFNRFYRPDVDLENLKITSSHIYSTPEENAMVLRWIGVLAGNVNCGLAATTGIHDGKTILKNLLVGARAVQVASAIYREGPDIIEKMLSEINAWLEEKGYDSINDITGKLKQSELVKPMIYERAQFMKYFSDAR